MKNIYFTQLGQYKIKQTFILCLILFTIINNIYSQINWYPSYLLTPNPTVEVTFKKNSTSYRQLINKSDSTLIDQLDLVGFRHTNQNLDYVNRYDQFGNEEKLVIINGGTTLFPNIVKFQVLKDSTDYFYDESGNYLDEFKLSGKMRTVNLQSLILEINKSESQREIDFENELSCLRSNGTLVEYLPSRIKTTSINSGKKLICGFTYQGRLLESFLYECDGDSKCKLLNSTKCIYTTNSQNKIVLSKEINVKVETLANSNVPIFIYFIDDYSNWYYFIQGENINGRSKGNDNINANIIISPNPANSEININMPNSIKENSILRILNLDGRLIEEKIINSNFINIDVSNYDSGVYLMKISDGVNIYIKKFNVIK